MSKVRAGGSASNLKDSNAQRLGVKRFGGQAVIPGNIIVRQRGNQFRPGTGTMEGKDRTIFATIAGKVKFTTRKVRKFTGRLEQIKEVSVEQ